MKKQVTMIMGVMLILIIGVSVWNSRQTKKQQTDQTDNGQQKTEKQQKNSQDQKIENNSEIESVQDLIEGEYKLSPFDTSSWQIYQNKDVGFECKIPANWFCGGPALDPNSKHSTICTDKKEKDTYYAGKDIQSEIIMINYLDLTDNIHTGTLRENLELKRNGEAKIYKLVVDNQESIISIDKNYETVDLTRNDRKWQIINYKYNDQQRSIFGGFLATFKFVN